MTGVASTAGLRTPAGTWWLLGSLYTTQFLALGFLSVALVALLQDKGASMSRLSLIYLLGTVWAFKLLWAPLLDHFGWARLGHYRGWLLLTQAGLVVAPLAMMALDPVADFPAVYALAVLIAVLSATQDVATDAIACRTLPEAERGLGNGIQTAGGLLGNLLGGGVLVMAYPSIGWGACMGWLAAGTAVSLVQLVWLREPGQRLTPLSARTLYGRLRTFWPEAGGAGWLLVLLLFPFAAGLGYGLVTPLLVTAGWGMERIGLVTNVAGSLLSAASALAAGWLLPRWGRRRALIIAAAINFVGSFAEDGWAGPVDLGKAADCYARAAEGGDFRGAFNHARMLIDAGQRDEALVWITRAGEWGNDRFRGQARAWLAASPLGADGVAALERGSASC